MDFHLLPLVRREGQDQAELPGLHITAPPRRPARGRQSDRLVFYLSMEGNAPVPQDQQDQLLKRLSESYYKTPGSVTAAMRTVIESLNQYLLDRNLRSASSGRQGMALLTLLTLRDNRLYLAQCGPVHAFLVTASGVRHIFDPQPARRGLGLGRTAPIFYAQAELSANDTLLVSHQPPAAWNETALGNLTGQGLESMRRRLLPLAGDELAAVLIQTKPGAGKTFLLKPKPMPLPAEESPAVEPESAPAIAPETTPAPTPSAETVPEAVTPEPVIEEEAPLAPLVREDIPTPAAAQPPEPVAPEISVATAAAAALPEVEFVPAKPVAPQPVPEQPQPVRGTAARRRRERGGQVAPVVATIGRAFGGVFGGLSQALGRLFQRMLPGEGALPASVMALGALVVPLVVVTVATVIYLQRGRGGKYDELYAQAVQAAGAAQVETNPLVQEQDWITVVGKLNLADSYSMPITAESQALRQQAQGAIDTLNLAVRLDFQPAISGGLPRDVQVSRIVASDTDLYLLDAAKGNVLRAFLAGNGYELDSTYQCGPGFDGSQGIGPLVDIRLFNKPDGSGTVLLGVDSLGGVLECTTGAPPLYTPLSPPPAGWSGIKAFDTAAGLLYVLDPDTKQIWVYANGKFTQAPDLFFDQDIPPLGDVIDLAVEQEDLYLLHKDGHLTQCSFSAFGVATTQCTEPAIYLDARTGREGLIMTPIPAFIEALSTQPPDPSLYLLDPGTPAIYHFSLRLAYQRRLQPQASVVTSGPLSAKPASAFALSPDSRLVFLAYGNDVVYAGMP